MVNQSYIKIFKAKGDFVLHRYADEFFWVIKGALSIKIKDYEIFLNEGDCFMVLKGVDHLLSSKDETHVLLVESKSVINTGNAESDKTVKNPGWL